MKMAVETISIVVVDDHPLFRQGVVHSLEVEPGFKVVGETSSGEEALERSRAQLPELVLHDNSMPGWSGITTAEKISIACPATAIVMLTVSDDKDKLLAALKAGARGYVLKGVSGRELAQVVRSAVAGDVYEREILSLIGTGLTNREIGERIFLSEKTVKHYVTNILQKLQVRSRVEAALVASRHGKSA
jgi:DNA-binding NarL/FixJ family response regulator